MKIEEIKDKEALKALKQLSTPRKVKKITISFRISKDDYVYKMMNKIKAKYHYSFQLQLYQAISKMIDDYAEIMEDD